MIWRFFKIVDDGFFSYQILRDINKPKTVRKNFKSQEQWMHS